MPKGWKNSPTFQNHKIEKQNPGHDLSVIEKVEMPCCATECRVCLWDPVSSWVYTRL